MPFIIVNDNFLNVCADVIVNPTDGADYNITAYSRMISEKAGSKYLEHIKTLPWFYEGNIIVSPAFDLKNKYIIHAAVSIWDEEYYGDARYLESCYQEAVYEMEERGLTSIVFPVLGIGEFNVPFEDALDIAFDSIRSCLHSSKHQITVYLAIDDDSGYDLALTKFPAFCGNKQNASWEYRSGLDDEILNKGESFYELLSKHMKLKGWDSAKCYQAAGVDKKLFSKIKNQPGYTPSKMTIIKFAFALIVFPEFEKLLEEVKRLRTEFSMLLLEKEELQYVICKNIETAYMLALGSLEYKAYEMECELLRLHRKIELIQMRINRQEKIDLTAIEQTLDDEFIAYQQIVAMRII